MSRAPGAQVDDPSSSDRRLAGVAIKAAEARQSFYRGGEGMFTWVLHRITGVGIFAFLFAHVLDTSLVIVSADVYDGVLAVYHHPIIKLMEIGLVVAVIYHGLNGIRITLVDFWKHGSARNTMMMRVQRVVFLVLALGAAIPMGAQVIAEIRQ
jgi:succinate dehydrogenase / fumarate reductase, cytochrome b subunit